MAEDIFLLQMLKKLFKPFVHWLGIPYTISGKVIFGFLIGLVTLNLIILIAYTGVSRSEEHIAITDEITNSLISALYLFDISSKSEWQKIADVTQTHELRLQLGNTPLYKKHLQSDAIDELKELIANTKEKTQFAIKLNDRQWFNVKYIPQSNAELWQVFIILLSTVITISFLFSAWSLFRFTTPLKKFKRAAEQLGVELRADPVLEYGPAIVRDTALAMNQMQKRIRSLIDDRNLMLAAISHDLRTPITRMKLRAQFMTESESYQETLEDLDEMEAMIKQILIYTKDTMQSTNLKTVDLVALLLAICDEKCEQGFDVECITVLKRAPVQGNPLGLKRAFDNLINNATKYAKKTVVTISQYEKCWNITIEDDGPGIPEEHLEKVFTAFYRVDSARSSNKGGTGLGLAIAHDVIRAHQGTIKLENRDEGGLRVKIIFPHKTMN